MALVELHVDHTDQVTDSSFWGLMCTFQVFGWLCER